MNDKLYCYYCNKDVIPKIIKKTNTYEIHKEQIKVNELIYLCPFCQNEINNNLDNSLYNIYNEYLKTYNLSFEKFKEIRKSYNLSQDLFAKALGWSKRTIIRYENADTLPQKQYLKIYQKIEANKDEFIKILKSNCNSIDKDTYYKIYNILETDIDLKTINVFLYILNKNSLTKTQIMKYLFAIDFLFFKENDKPLTNLKYAHGFYGPMIDKKDAYLNYLIKQNYLEMVNSEDDIILFKAACKCDLSLFNQKEIEIMNKVINNFKGKNAKKLSEWSHNFKGWQDTKNGEEIKFTYAKYFELDNN